MTWYIFLLQDGWLEVSWEDDYENERLRLKYTDDQRRTKLQVL